MKLRITEHLYSSRSHHKKSYIDSAIGKYGIDAFEVSGVEECSTEDELNQREKFWICQFNCKVPNGYNLTDGGDGVSGNKRSLEYRTKMSKAIKGKNVHLKRAKGCLKLGWVMKYQKKQGKNSLLPQNLNAL